MPARAGAGAVRPSGGGCAPGKRLRQAMNQGVLRRRVAPARPHAVSWVVGRVRCVAVLRSTRGAGWPHPCDGRHGHGARPAANDAVGCGCPQPGRVQPTRPFGVLRCACLRSVPPDLHVGRRAGAMSPSPPAPPCQFRSGLGPGWVDDPPRVWRRTREHPECLGRRVTRSRRRACGRAGNRAAWRGRGWPRRGAQTATW